MSQNKSKKNKKKSTAQGEANLGEVNPHQEDGRGASEHSNRESDSQKSSGGRPRRSSKGQKLSTEDTQAAESPSVATPVESPASVPLSVVAPEQPKASTSRVLPPPRKVVQIRRVSTVSQNVTKMHARMQAVQAVLEHVNETNDVYEDDPFEDAGQSSGLQVWRVVRREPVPVEPEMLGKFHSADCYIVLYTYPGSFDESTKCIHYWIGKDASYVKAGICVFRALKLHEKLDRQASIFREEQNDESERFIAYFAENHIRIQYLAGGVADDGLNKVEHHEEFEKRLIQVTGETNELLYVKRAVIKPQNLVKEDVFVFEGSPQKIFVWIGRESSKAKQIRGIDIATLIKQEERKGKPELELVMHGEEPDDFLSLILEDDDDHDDVHADEDGHTDDEEDSEDNVILYRVRVSPDTSKIDVKTIEDRPLSREMLFTNCAYVLECKYELYVWYGKKAKEIERKYALALALKLKKISHSRMQIESMFEDAETVLFKQRFHIGFYIKDTPELWDKRRAELETISQVKFEETHAIFEEAEDDEDKSMIDDGLGRFHMWRVVDNKKIEPVNEHDMGHFYSGDCYIIWYQQNVGNNDDEDDDDDYDDDDEDDEDEDQDEAASEQLAAYKSMKKQAKKKKIYFVPIRVLYFWEGHDSEQRQYLNFWRKNWKKLSTDQKNAPRIVNVEQYKEPDHMLKIFENCIVVHRGSSTAPQRKGPALFRVYCKNKLNTRAIEVEPRKQSLNSSDVYIVRGTSGNYLWIGKYATELKKRSAWVLNGSVMGDTNTRDPIIIDEGFEPEEFWEELSDGNVIGQEYCSERLPLETRLLMCCLTPSGYKVLYLGDVGKHFSFDDLRSCHYVIIVHAVYKVYIWYPNQLAFKVERRLAMKHAEDLAERSEKVTPEIEEIHRDQEPDGFKFLFPEWDYRYRVYQDIHEANRRALLAKLQEEYIASAPVLAMLHSSSFLPLLQSDSSVNTENAVILYRLAMAAESFTKLASTLRDNLRTFSFVGDTPNVEQLVRQLTSQLWNTLRSTDD